MKSFSANIVLRVVLLLLTMVALSYIFGRSDLLFNHLILGFLLIFQVYGLIHYVQLTNRKLAKLLMSIKNNDFTVSFGSMEHDRQFSDLQHSFKEIIDAYKNTKTEKEAQYKYLQLIVKHINVGIISLKGNDEIALINQPALDTLQISTYHYWHNLKNSQPLFVEQVEQMREDESKLLEVPIGGEVKRLSVHISTTLLLGQPYRIITFQDISRELGQEEINAWHKLIRILTHEIMNSVTPISSLSETMQMMLLSDSGKLKKTGEVDQATLEDLAYSLQTIQKRSDGLLGFVEDYRKLSKIPRPQPELIVVRGLLEDMGRLMQIELRKQNIKLSIKLPDNQLKLIADRRLLEQILINLMTNSCQALVHTPNPQIELSAKETDNKIVLEVADNGSGLAADKLDKIFVPFFSTKKQGSGIGLSLSRTIMNQHGGSIKVNALKEGLTVFSLAFPKLAVVQPTDNLSAL